MKKLTFLLITKRVESLLQAIQYGQKKYRAFITLAMNTRYGRSDRVRTCGIDVPNKTIPIFCLIYKAFRGFLVQKRCFRVLLQALFPRSPKPQMVKDVVKPQSEPTNQAAIIASSYRQVTERFTPCRVFLLPLVYHTSEKLSTPIFKMQ